MMLLFHCTDLALDDYFDDHLVSDDQLDSSKTQIPQILDSSKMHAYTNIIMLICISLTL